MAWGRLRFWQIRFILISSVSFAALLMPLGSGVQRHCSSGPPPEQVLGNLDAQGPSCDIYSLGVILYESLTGRLPFEGPSGAVIGQILAVEPEPPSKHRPTLDPALEAICLKAMAKQAASRFASMKEFAAALSEYLRGGAAAAPSPYPVGTDTRLPRPLDREFAASATAAPSADLPQWSEAPTARIRALPSTTGRTRGWNSARRLRHLAAIAGLSAVIVVVGIGVITAPRKQDGGEMVKMNPGQIDPKPPPQLAAPPLAIAPCTPEQARQHQEAWAKYLGADPFKTNSIGMKLVLIPPGKFLMGSPPSEVGRRENELQHRVRITKPFYLGAYEVTQREYQAVMGNNPSYFSPEGAGKDEARGQDGSQFPVENVSWDDANEFCRKLSAMAAEKSARRVYRLPTEAEWEYACRAGTTTPFHFGGQCNGAKANCNGNFPYGTNVKGPNLGRTAQVGSYAPNPFGLGDMHGNVWEWCSDSAAAGSFRVIRGGGWNDVPVVCRSARRGSVEPAYRGNFIGFRVVRAR